MAFICVFFPAIIMCGVRKMIWKGKEQKSGADWKRAIFEYASCCVFLNLLLLAFLALFRQNTQDIYEKLNMYSNFAMKYLLSAVFLAVAVPFVEKYLRENVTVSFIFDRDSFAFPASSISRWISKYGLYLLAFVAVGMHFVRIFDRAFWWDETAPLLTEKMGLKEMLHWVAAAGHTPLHYGIIWVLYRIFGDSGAMYHFVSLFPYIIIALVSVTLIRKWFGKRVAMILILLSALLENAVRYNVEVRMYSWCQMFIFLAFLMMYQVLRIKKARCYVLMAAYSLGAVYSHSFAIAPVGILYIFLLVYVVAKDRKATWKVFLSGGSVLLFFLPWLLYGKHVNGKFVSQYGNLHGTSWRSCLEYIFSSKYSLLILVLFVVLFVIIFIKDTGIARVQPGVGGEKQLKISLIFREWTFSAELVWLLAGVAAVFGTIAAAEWFEHVFYPIITVRYLYPAFVLVWLAFGICISKCKIKKLVSVIVTFLLLISCVPAYFNTLRGERNVARNMERTLDATSEISEEGGYILTNQDGVQAVGKNYYYPNLTYVYFDGESLPEFHPDEINWLFLKDAISTEMESCVKERGYSVELVVSNGNVGTYYPVWIYKLVK